MWKDPGPPKIWFYRYNSMKSVWDTYILMLKGYLHAIVLTGWPSWLCLNLKTMCLDQEPYLKTYESLHSSGSEMF